MRRASASGRAPGGFTLIELLVATVAFAILFAAVYVVFTNGKRLRDQSTELTRASHFRARAASIIRADLRDGWVSGGRLAASLAGGSESPVSQYPGYLKLTSAGGGATNGGIQEVEYFVAEDPWATNRSGGLLMRAVNRNLLAPVREPAQGQALLSRVRELRPSFYDGEQWLESWDQESRSDQTPEAVFVRVEFVAPMNGEPRIPPLELLASWGAQPFMTNSAVSTNATASTSGNPAGGSGGNGGPGAGGGGR